MRKRTLLVIGLFVVLMMASSPDVYAGLGGENCPLKGACSSIGGFLYNALPWNWGNWWGK